MNGLTELEKQSSAEKMKLFLLDIKSKVDKVSLSTNALTLDRIIPYEESYDSIKKYGQEENFKLNFDSKTAKSKKR